MTRHKILDYQDRNWLIKVIGGIIRRELNEYHKNPADIDKAEKISRLLHNHNLILRDEQLERIVERIRQIRRYVKAREQPEPEIHFLDETTNL